MALKVVLRVPRQRLFTLIVIEGTLSPMVAENWVLIFVLLCITMNYRKEVKKMSFYELLKKEGYKDDVARRACINLENDLPVSLDIEELYWEWRNEMNKEWGEL